MHKCPFQESKRLRRVHSEVTNSFNRPLTNIFQWLQSCLEKTLSLAQEDMPANSSTSSNGEAWWKPNRNIQLFLQRVHFIISLFGLITWIFFFFQVLSFSRYFCIVLITTEQRLKMKPPRQHKSDIKKKMNSFNVSEINQCAQITEWAVIL